MRTILLLLCAAAGCASQPTSHPVTAAEHERNAEHYEATAASIEKECGKALRHEYTVDPWAVCWKGEDIRFLQANLDAAAAEREAAARLEGRPLETQQASR